MMLDMQTLQVKRWSAACLSPRMLASSHHQPYRWTLHVSTCNSNVLCVIVTVSPFQRVTDAITEEISIDFVAALNGPVSAYAIEEQAR